LRPVAAGDPLENWLKRFYESGGNTVDPEIWQGTFETLKKAAATGTGINLAKTAYNSPDFRLQTQLEQNAGVFAAFKNHQEQEQLVRLLKDEKGSVRTWSQFLNEARPLTGQYNRNWLKTEYNQAVANAQMAKKWIGFEENADIYPNLEYRAVMDQRTRPEHAILNGIIRPINDPFWSRNYPPNGWGCRCSVVQTDRDVTPGKSVPDFKPDPGFDFNPGIDKKLFADSAGHYQTTDKKQVREIGEKLTNKASRSFGISQVGKVAKVKGLGDVNITKKGIKEAVNQPHAEYYAKNAALENISGMIKGLKFKTLPGVKNNPMVKQYHYAEIELMGKTSYVILREMVDGEIRFYTITDTMKGYQ